MKIEINKLIEKRGSGPKTHYVLATTVRYRPISSYKTNIDKVAEERLKNLVLNERQEKALEFLRKYGKITNKEYRELNQGITDKTVFRDLKDLVNKKIIIAKGKKKGRYYELA